MLAIVPSNYKEPSFWKTANNFKDTLNIKVLSSAGAIQKTIQFGWTKDKSVIKFKHIGIGMEGASNVNQNQPVANSAKTDIVLDGSEVSTTFGIDDAEEIREAWLNHAKEHINSWKEIPVKEKTLEQILEPLELVLKSVKKAIGDVVGEKQGFGELRVLLFQQPQATQKVFNAVDVFAETGHYYIRNNEDNKEHWADPPAHLPDWFCAIPKLENDQIPNYMVPSYPQNNVLLDNRPGETSTTGSRMLREDVGQVVLTNLTLP